MTKRKNITVEQTGSAIGRPGRQRQTLIGLGLNRIGRLRGVAGHARHARHDRQSRASRARRRRAK